MAEAVFEIGADIGGFNSAVQRFVSGIAKMESAVNSFSGKVNKQTSSVDGRFSGLTDSVRDVANQLDRNLSRSLSRAAREGASLGTIIGTTVVGAFRSLGSEIQRLGSFVLGVVQDFDRLQFSLQALSAVELVNSGQFDDVSDALGEAEERAKGTLLFLQDLAVISPFTTRPLAEANKLLRVYGFLEEEANDLTLAMTDYASGVQLSEQNLQRISLAIGQIRTEGRLLARDALQLTAAGVQVYDKLAESMGISVAELQKLQRLGNIPSTLALQSVVDFFEEFEGSAKRVADTLVGVISSLKDAGEIATKDLAGALFNEVLPSLQGLRDIIASPGFRAGVIVLGLELGQNLAKALAALSGVVNNLISSWNALPDSVQRAVIIFAAATVVISGFVATLGILFFSINLLVNPITIVISAIAGLFSAFAAFSGLGGLVRSAFTVVSGAINGVIGSFQNFLNSVGNFLGDIESELGDFVNTVTGWGEAVAAAFADGITSGAGFVAQAVDALISPIIFLLQAFSPPRALPDLTKWGTAASDAYLEGWELSNFEALDTFTRTIEELLRGLEVQGGIEEDQILPTLREGREDLARAINEIVTLGRVSDSTLDAIRSGFAGVGNEAVRLVLTYQDLAIATQKVAQLQEKLNAAQRVQRDVDRQVELAGLQRLLATEGVSELRKQGAQARITELSLESQLETAEKQVEESKNEFDLLLAQYQVQIDQLDIIEKQEALMKRLNKSARNRQATAKKTLSPLEKQLKAIQLQEQELKDLIDLERARAVLESDLYSDAEKAEARLTIQRIEAQQALRRIELGKLGFDEKLLDDLAEVAIALADLNLKKGEGGSGPLGEIVDDLEFMTSADTQKKLDEFNAKIAAIQEQFDGMKKSVSDAVAKINDGLPSLLKLTDGEGGSPLLNTLLATLVGLTSSALIGRLGVVVQGLLGVRGALGLVSGAVGVTAAAFTGNWLNIRTQTQQFVQTINRLLLGINIAGLLKIFEDISVIITDVFAMNPVRDFDDFIQNMRAVLGISRSLIKAWIDDISKFELGVLINGVFLAFDQLKGIILSLIAINILPVLAGIRKIFISIGTQGTALNKVFSGLKKSFKNPIASIKALGLTLLGLIKRFGNLLARVTFTTAFFRTNLSTWKTLFREAFNPIGVIISRFGTLFSFVFKLFSLLVSSIVKQVINEFRRLGSVFRFVITVFKSLGLIAIGVTSSLSKLIFGFSRSLLSAIVSSRAFGFVLRFLSNQFLILKDTFAIGIKLIVKNFISNLSVLGQIIVFQISKFQAGFKIIFSNISFFLKNSARLVIASARVLFSPIVASIKSAGLALLNVLKLISGVISRSSRSIASSIKVSFLVIREFSGLLKDLFVRSIGGLFKGLPALIKPAVTSIKQQFNVLKLVFAAVSKSLLGPVRQGFNIILLTMKNLGVFIKPILERIASLSKSIGPILGSAIRFVVSQFQKLLPFFAPAFQSLIEGISVAVSFVAKRFTSFKSLLVSISGPILGFVRKILPDFGLKTLGVGAAFKAIGRIIARFIPIINVLSIASLLFSLAWENNFLGIQEKTKAFFDKIGLNFEAFKEAIGTLGEAWSATGRLILDFFKGLLQVRSLDDLITLFKDTGSRFVSEVLPLFTSGFSQLASVFVDWIKNIDFAGILSGLGTFLMGVVQWINEQIPVVISALLNWTGAFIEWAINLLSAILPGLGRLIGGILSFLIGTVAPAIIKGIAFVVSSIVQYIANPEFRESVNSAVGEWWSGIAEGIAPAWENFKTRIGNAITNNLIPALKQFGSNILQGIVDGFNDFLAAFGFDSTVQDIATTITDGIKDAFSFVDLVADFVSRLKQSFEEGNFLELIAAIAKAVGANIATGVRDGIVDKWDELKSGVANRFGNPFAQEVREVIEADSPSQLFYDKVGVPIAEGIEEGAGTLSLDTLADLIKNTIRTEFERARTQSVENAAAIRSGVEAEFILLKNNLDLLSRLTVDLILLSFENLKISLSEKLALVAADAVLVWDALRLRMFEITELMKTDVLLQMGELSAGIIGEEGIALSLVSEVERFFKDMKDKSVEQSTDMKNLIISNDDSIFKTLIAEMVEDFVEKGESLGDDWVEGIIDGILSEENLEALYDAGFKAGETVEEGYKDATNISSPSRTAIELGKLWTQGLVIGITDQEGDIEGASASILDSLMQNIGDIPIGLQLVTATQQISLIMTNIMTSIQSSMATIIDGLDQASRTLLALSGLSAIDASFAPRLTDVSAGSSFVTSSTNNFNLNVNSTQRSQGVVDDFSIMQVLAAS
jgi:tape measure domain-containing protein